MFKTGGVIVAAAAAMLLAACGVSKSRPESGSGTIAAPVGIEQPAGPGLAGPGLARPGVYRIDAAQSELRLLVRRAGPLAHLGHNHVIVNRAVSGWVRFAGDATAASFAISVPAAEFVVDDSRSRGEEGPDFAEPVADDAKAGTRHNMLSAALLDVEHSPRITVASVWVKPVSGSLAATVAVDVAGHASTLVVPFALDTAAGRITASGTVTLRQTALGLTPFSVMLGALQVDDAFTVKFKLIAEAT